MGLLIWLSEQQILAHSCILCPSDICVCVCDLGALMSCKCVFGSGRRYKKRKSWPQFGPKKVWKDANLDAGERERKRFVRASQASSQRSISTLWSKMNVATHWQAAAARAGPFSTAAAIFPRRRHQAKADLSFFQSWHTPGRLRDEQNTTQQSVSAQQ